MSEKREQARRVTRGAAQADAGPHVQTATAPGDPLMPAEQTFGMRDHALVRAPGGEPLAGGAAELEAVFEATPGRISIFDADGTIVRLNRAAERQAGPPRGGERLDAVQRAYGLRTVDGAPFPTDELPVARALRGEVVTGVEMCTLGPDGEDQYMMTSAAPIFDDAGRVRGAVAIAHDITPLRRAEREAAARAGQLEAIFDAITDGVFVYDAVGHVIRTNASARELLAMDAVPEYAALSLDERRALLAPRDRHGQPLAEPPQPVTRILRGEVLAGETALDLVLRRLDGQLIDVNLTGAPIRDASGAILGGVCILRDVTERRALERDVHARARQLEAVIAAITDVVHVYDREGRLIQSNDAARALDTRLRDPGYLGHPFDQRVATIHVRDEQGNSLPADQVPAARVLRGEVLTGARAADTLIQMTDGRAVLLNTTGAPVRGPEGEVIGGVIVSRDVTARRALERRTREALAALLAMAQAVVTVPRAGDGAADCESGESGVALAARELAELARRVIGADKVAIVSLDDAESIVPVAVAGVSAEEDAQWQGMLRGLPLARFLDAGLVTRLRAGEIFAIDTTPEPRASAALGATSALLAPMRIGRHLTGVLSLDAGKPLDSYTADDTALAGAVAQLAALVVERDRLLRERAAAQAQVLALTETNHLMNEFLGIAGHELRTPLTSTKANAQLALREMQRLRADLARSDIAAALRRLRPLVERIERQSTRQERLISDLLDVSRIEAGKLDLHPEPADLAAIVREVVDEHRTLYAPRTLTLDLPAKTALPLVADADRIGQVVANYLSNAFKYSGAETPVAVRVTREGGMARVAVQDHGLGLAPEERERVWDRFYRAAGITIQTGSGVGLGLGLHIARTIVERHDGTVGVESEVGRGSTFWFTLPLAPIAAADATSPPAPARP